MQAGADQCKLVLTTVLQCKMVLTSALQCKLVLTSALQCKLVLTSALQCKLVLTSSLHCSLVLSSAMRVRCHAVSVLASAAEHNNSSVASTQGTISTVRALQLQVRHIDLMKGV